MRKKFPNVSVIILTYNGAKYIEALLESLSEQSYPKERMEIIVVDNASTDNTCEKVKKIGGTNVRQIRLDKNAGYARGNNIALTYAKYEYIALLNQDTVCHQNWLAGLVDGLAGQEGTGACTSNMIMCRGHHFLYSDLSGKVSTLGYYNLTCFGYARYYRGENSASRTLNLISGCSLIIRKQTINQLGYLFDEDLQMYVEDTDLSLRIQNAGLKVGLAAESVVYHLHSNRDELTPKIFKRVKKAIQNRAIAFYMNMSTLEFSLFFPFLFLGSPFKLFELSLSPLKKISYFFPFSLASLIFIFSALFQFPQFSAKKKQNLSIRQKGKQFLILKLLLTGCRTRK